MLPAPAGTLPTAHRCRTRPEGPAFRPLRAARQQGGEPALMGPLQRILGNRIHHRFRRGTTGLACSAAMRAQRCARSGYWASRASSQISRIARRSVMVLSLVPASSASQSNQRACCAQPPRSISNR